MKMAPNVGLFVCKYFIMLRDKGSEQAVEHVSEHGSEHAIKSNF